MRDSFDFSFYALLIFDFILTVIGYHIENSGLKDAAKKGLLTTRAVTLSTSYG